MFPYPLATPTNCNIQTFYGENSPRGAWNKPPGVSHVYILLIGAGGNGDGTLGGGSGAITVWYGAAQHVPDTLYAFAQTGGGGASSVRANFATIGITQILVATGGAGSVGGTTNPATPFASSGFYQTIAGQNGVAGTQSESTTTFLSGGGGNVINGNYGYSVNVGRGIFQMQPIIVGVGGAVSNSGGIGCGGGYLSGVGGPGMVLIASW